MDDQQLRTAMGKFATGITVIATEVEGEVHGMTANAFMLSSYQYVQTDLFKVWMEIV